MLRVLLVNPWIEDFAAYDLWARPLGLLYLGSLLENAGACVRLLDCLAREHTSGTDGKWGTGKYQSSLIPKPDVLAWVPRHYHRYGMGMDEFEDRISSMEVPDFILITCQMTYWYRGAFLAARLLRRVFPRATIILGGVYAFLCCQHAKSSGLFNHVLTEKDLPSLAATLSDLTGLIITPDLTLVPAYHLYGSHLKHAAFLTGWGCPYNCTYCATPLMYSKLVRKTPTQAAGELARILSVTQALDIAFYDDALLVHRENHFRPLLREMMMLGIRTRFHLPNAVHPRWLDDALCHEMKKAGFTTIRLGFESMGKGFLKRSSHKVSRDAIEKGVKALFNAGYTCEQVGAYILFGVPGLEVGTTLADIAYAHSLGVKIYLACYSPIPGTPDYERSTRLWADLDREPLLHNNTLTMIRQAEDYAPVKAEVLALNRRLLENHNLS